MKKFFIITNLAKDPDHKISEGIVTYLKANGASCAMRGGRRAADERHRVTRSSEIPEGTECIIVLGGDGTLMRAAGDVYETEIPLLGINLGTLGYLAEIDRASIYPALDSLLRDEFQIERRMMLKGTVWHQGEKIYQGVALNDIVISRQSAVPHVISLYNFVNDAYLNYYRADGVIISSPTGSTGYSLSAGGPIISPEASLFLMTPLAAHTLNTRSVVLPADNKITVKIGPGRDNTVEQACAYFDGDRSAPMETDDYVDIEKAEKDIRIVKIRNDSFLETLRRKMSTI